MHTVIVKCSGAKTCSDLIARVSGNLGLPAYCGRNLDALEDCMWEVYRPTNLILIDVAAGREQHGDYVDRLVEVLQDSAAQIDGFTLELCE